MAGSHKKPRKVKPHQSKYSGKVVGNNEKKTIESLLSQLRSIESFSSTEDYHELREMDSKSKDYYHFVRRLYFKYAINNKSQ